MQKSEIEIPADVVRRWQSVVDLLAEVIDVPLALITRLDAPALSCIVANGDNATGIIQGSSWAFEQETFCSFTMAERSGFWTSEARGMDKFKHVSALELGLASYIGYPIQWADETFFGTLCVLDRPQSDHKESHRLLIGLLRDALEADLRTLWTSEQRAEQQTIARQAIEREVDKRTADLVAALKRADAADRAKSQFLANVTHELRTPLNAIVGSAECIAKKLFGPLEDARYPGAAEVILSAAHQLRTIIEDLLEMSRAAAGLTEIVFEEVDVGYLVSHVLRRIRPLASDAAVQIKSELYLRTDSIVSNEGYLTKILFNILSNAVKFSEPKAIAALVVRSSETDIEFVIQDQGIGISEADVAALSNPFTQVEGGLGKSKQGAGIGLSLAMMLTGLLGGKFKIESRLGLGTTVSINFPRAPLPAQAVG